MNALPPDAAVDRLCELNVIEQTRHVCETTSVQDAWARGQALDVHGWIYGLDNGRLHDLGFVARRQDDVRPGYDRAVGKLAEVVQAFRPAVDRRPEGLHYDCPRIRTWKSGCFPTSGVPASA